MSPPDFIQSFGCRPVGSSIVIYTSDSELKVSPLSLETPYNPSYILSPNAADRYLEQLGTRIGRSNSKSIDAVGKIAGLYESGEHERLVRGTFRREVKLLIEASDGSDAYHILLNRDSMRFGVYVQAGLMAILSSREHDPIDPSRHNQWLHEGHRDEKMREALNESRIHKINGAYFFKGMVLKNLDRKIREKLGMKDEEMALPNGRRIYTPESHFLSPSPA